MAWRVIVSVSWRHVRLGKITGSHPNAHFDRTRIGERVTTTALPPTLLSWSGGKDAAYALFEMYGAGDDDRGSFDSASDPSVALLTQIDDGYDRSSMHGVRQSLYARQADAIGLPIEFLRLPTEPSNEEYEAAVSAAFESFRDRGVREIVYADIHLEDVRAYRERLLEDTTLDGEDTGLDGQWPLWGRDTRAVVESVIDAGFEAILVAVDDDVLDASFAGRTLDERLLEDLPPGVDPAGEGGEFHTFVIDGPYFDDRVAVEIGETVTRSVGDGEFHYCDLLPGET